MRYSRHSHHLLALCWCEECEDWVVGGRETYLWNDMNRAWYHGSCSSNDLKELEPCGPIKEMSSWA